MVVVGVCRCTSHPLPHSPQGKITAKHPAVGGQGHVPRRILLSSAPTSHAYITERSDLVKTTPAYDKEVYVCSPHTLPSLSLPPSPHPSTPHPWPLLVKFSPRTRWMDVSLLEIVRHGGSWYGANCVCVSGCLCSMSVTSCKCGRVTRDPVKKKKKNRLFSTRITCSGALT